MPRCARMTSTDREAHLHRSAGAWEVVVRTNLIEPLASWATWRTFPSAIRKTSKREVDFALKSLIGCGVLPKPGYVTKKAVVTTDRATENYSGPTAMIYNDSWTTVILSDY